MAYRIEANQNNCYPGTTCLINKFGITDEKKLSELEAQITLARTVQLLESPLSDTFDFEHYKAIHRFLFNDLYDWAGKLRTTNMSKKGTSFCSVSELETSCNNCFNYLLDNKCFVDLKRDDFIEAITDFYCTTNILHPFREGNGRTQRIFITQLATISALRNRGSSS